MPRLMSVAYTEQAVVERRKTVTRRKGWTFLKPGDQLTLCRKVMGRKSGEPLVRICDVEVLAVTREPLCAIAGTRVRARDELSREGFPPQDDDPLAAAHDFMVRYFGEPQGIGPMDDVTRIEWRYLDAEATP